MTVPGTPHDALFRALAEGTAAVSVAAVRVMDPQMVEVGGVATADSEIEIAELEALPAPAPDQRDGGS